jgi:choline-glycine betaine transporter
MWERTFWRAVVATLAVVLLALVTAHAMGTIAVPAGARAFVVSCLVCVGVGATVASPRSSPVRLDAAAERAVRRRQTSVALVLSVALGLLLWVPEVRRGPTPWVLAPVIALGPVLAARERLGRP